MQRTSIAPDFDKIPSDFYSLMAGAAVFDSSCSPEARVFFIDRDNGYYLKTAPKNSLKRESQLTEYFHRKGLGPEVCAYLSEERDWLLTGAIPGEDCIHPMYLKNPTRLCETTAELLWNLHHTDHTGCPVSDHTKLYLERVTRNYKTGNYDKSTFPDSFGYTSADEAWAAIQRNAKYLQSDMLIHGDYCLPNIILNNWRFSGFIDLDCAGVGDRHVDLFWGVWTLFFNLKTNKYQDRFLDAYGRSEFEPEILRLIAACEAFG
ncbi:MAG: aminoglycoside 3'-phosphotransferase [Oscillospiraceae bacterium]|nr:aminoglycoside 3'-phosphotransferase [Oscillospiraceae bacterium]